MGAFGVILHVEPRVCNGGRAAVGEGAAEDEGV